MEFPGELHVLVLLGEQVDVVLHALQCALQPFVVVLQMGDLVVLALHNCAHLLHLVQQLSMA